MKQSVIFAAYTALQKLQNQDLPCEIAFDLYQMEMELKPVYDFQTEQHRKVLEAYQPTYNDETKEFVFKSPEDRDAFLEKSRELDNLEYEVKAEMVRIPMKAEYGLKIKPKEIGALKEAGLVEFYKDAPFKPEDIQIVGEPKLIPIDNAKEE